MADGLQWPLSQDLLPDLGAGLNDANDFETNMLTDIDGEYHIGKFQGCS